MFDDGSWQDIGCRTFYDTLFHHWGNRLRPTKKGEDQEVLVVVDSDDEDEKAEVESLRAALEEALGMFPPQVSIKEEPLVRMDTVQLDGYELGQVEVEELPLKAAAEDLSVKPAALQDEGVSQKPRQPLPDEGVSQEPAQPSAKVQPTGSKVPAKDLWVDMSVDDIALKIQDLQFRGLYLCSWPWLHAHESCTLCSHVYRVH